ncbi:MAG: ATP-binding protein [Candidatus Micrarchaeota archaeon]
MKGYLDTPYFPQDPVDPKYFVGRDEVIKTFKDAFQSVLKGRAANAAIYGERGMGKTSLLMKLKTLPPSGCFVVYCPLSDKSDQKAFVDALLQKIDLDYRESLPIHKFLIEKVKEIPEKIESFNVFDLSLSLRKGEMDPYRALLESLLKLRKRGFKGAYILIDEADLLTTEALALIRNSIQEIRSIYRFPVGIIAAGKQRLTKRLGGKWSPLSRFFALMEQELKPLNEKEVFEALTVPHVAWTKDAAKLVFDRSNGYPTVVQLYGATCYLRRNSTTITKELVQKIDAEVKEELWQWFQNGWKDSPSDLEAKCIAVVAKNGGSATYSQVEKALKKIPAMPLRRAVEKHILSQDERGTYSVPHKLIAELFLENTRNNST